VNGFKWDISFPTGSSIQNIIYSYSVEKEVQDSFTVTVSTGSFSSTDDWSGLPGTRLNRIVPVTIPGEDVTSGSITSSGTGTVTDPTVVYTYTYEPTEEVVDTLSYYDDPLQYVEEVDTYEYAFGGDDQKEASEEEELTEGSNKIVDPLFAGLASIIPNSYKYDIPGGVYEDTLTFPVNSLPDNRAGRLNSYAQDVKHRAMVDSQYGDKK